MKRERTGSKILWAPDKAAIMATLMAQFAQTLGLEPLPYERLHRYSIAHMGEFWERFWDFAGIIGDGTGPALQAHDSPTMSSTRFFLDRQFSFAENILAGDPNRVAIVEANETGIQQEISMAELRARVARAQAGLTNLGVGIGDRVVGMLPNTPDALVMLLAVSSIGAVWSSCSPEFGVTGIVDRFGQVNPKVLVVASEYLYNGRWHDITERSAEIAAALNGLEHMVIMGEGALPNAPCPVHRFDELGDTDASEPSFVRLPFNQPLYIVYTSGTTGLPKCIVHGAGGTLINLRKEHMLHCDIKPGDRVLYYSNTAWMMYHWMITTLASGATIVLYDGAAIPKKADELDYGVLWRIAEQARATHFGTSPKYLFLQQQHGYQVGKKHDLSSLRMILSSGAPLTEENFKWVYNTVKKELCLASISGGTEILGCFVMGNPTLPVIAGEIQGPALGMAVNVMDERNAPIVGRKGELVCTEPFPSMPLEFWGANGRQRYLDEYFSERPEIWTHGDLAEVTDAGGIVISGRTDTTLKPGGIRIGTGEIYRIVELIPELEDSLVIGYPQDGDTEVWLFVVVKNQQKLDSNLENLIRDRLRREASPRHVPKRIIAVPEIPYTLSGKKVEKAVLQHITGVPVKNRGSLVNPDCLEAFLEETKAVLTASG